MRAIRAFKLLRQRKDGSLGPLFINCRQRIPVGVWLKAESWPTKGFALRPGWHVGKTPHAPHLSERGRVWYEVRVRQAEFFRRPRNQGSVWLIAKWMKVVKPVKSNGSATINGAQDWN